MVFYEVLKERKPKDIIKILASVIASIQKEKLNIKKQLEQSDGTKTEHKDLIDALSQKEDIQHEISEFKKNIKVYQKQNVYEDVLKTFLLKVEVMVLAVLQKHKDIATKFLRLKLAAIQSQLNLIEATSTQTDIINLLKQSTTIDDDLNDQSLSRSNLGVQKDTKRASNVDKEPALPRSDEIVDEEGYSVKPEFEDYFQTNDPKINVEIGENIITEELNVDVLNTLRHLKLGNGSGDTNDRRQRTSSMINSETGVNQNNIPKHINNTSNLIMMDSEINLTTMAAASEVVANNSDRRLNNTSNLIGDEMVLSETAVGSNITSPKAAYSNQEYKIEAKETINTIMKKGEIQKILISGIISIRMLKKPLSPIILTFENYQSIERFVVNDQFCEPSEKSFSSESNEKLSYKIKEDLYNYIEKDIVVVKYALNPKKIGNLPIYIIPETIFQTSEEFFQLNYKSEGYIFDKLAIGVSMGNSQVITNPAANYDAGRGVFEWMIDGNPIEKGAIIGTLKANTTADGVPPGDVFCSFLISKRLMSMLEVDSNGVFDVAKSIVNGTYSAEYS